MRVLIIGAGKIGAGYLAPLFHRAGWHVTFAARTSRAAARMGRAGAFTARVVPAPRHPDGSGQDATRSTIVEGWQVAPIGTADFRRAVGEADLACTAVGVGNVTALAPALADALAERGPGRPLDVWVVENGNCAPQLAEATRVVAGGRAGDLSAVGFAGAVATVAVSRGSWDDHRPEFIGDDARRLLVDARPLATAVGTVGELDGVEPTRHYAEALVSKLHVFNAGHAVCAYLGWLRGHATVDAAAADPFLRPVVAGAMLESRRALLAAHPVLGGDVNGPVADALRRFANPRLGDPVARVARDPVRKLGRCDRLVGPVLAVQEQAGRVPAHFAVGIAGALLYRNPDDGQAVALQERLAARGVMAVLSETCGIAPDDPLAAAIASRYRGFIFTDDEVAFPPAYTPPAPQQAVEVRPR